MLHRPFFHGSVFDIDHVPLDPAGTLRWIDRLRWSGLRQWKAAAKQPLRVAGKEAGYTQTAGRFSYILIKEAGHMVLPRQVRRLGDVFLNLVTHRT